jgi:tetratricopeptide (TPR) repeat protein
MASPQRPDDPYSEGPAPETSTRRHRSQGQLDFELEFLGAVLARDPLNADVLKVHADNLAARGNYHRALQADQMLVRLRPDRPIPWYNLACSCALLGLTDKAFSALERALRLGYSHLAHLRRDPDLNALRDDPRFARLLRRY